MINRQIHVEMTTPSGLVFSGDASAVELRTVDGMIAVTPWEGNYMSFTHTSEITLRIGTEFLTFLLEKASASVGDGSLTVIAEEIRAVPAPPISAS